MMDVASGMHMKRFFKVYAKDNIVQAVDNIWGNSFHSDIVKFRKLDLIIMDSCLDLVYIKSLLIRKRWMSTMPANY